MLGHQDLSLCDEFSKTSAVIERLSSKDGRNWSIAVCVLIKFLHNLTHGNIIEHHIFSKEILINKII